MSQYIITDGSRYIYKNHSNKFVPSHGEAMADIYTLKQAEGILNNSLPKPLRKIFRVQKYDKDSDNVKQVTRKELKNTEKLEKSDNIQTWINRVMDLNGLIQDASTRKDVLNKELVNVEQEILDCLHYIEFCNLNAAQGYNAYKMIKARRLKRRSIKNEIAVLNVILEKKISKSVADEIRHVIEAMDRRTYEPRKLTELFDL